VTAIYIGVCYYLRVHIKKAVRDLEIARIISINIISGEPKNELSHDIPTDLLSSMAYSVHTPWELQDT
jgi:hypothetical protein